MFLLILLFAPSGLCALCGVTSSSPLTSVCPFGVLFDSPVRLQLNGSLEPSQFCVQRDICTGRLQCLQEWDDPTFQWVAPANPSHSTFRLSNLSVDDCVESEVTNGLEEKETPPPPRFRREAAAPEGGGVEDRRALEEQTHRLFYFLGKLNGEEVGAPLRLLSLFTASLRLVNVLCDSTFLHELFLDKLHDAFFFLLKETGLHNVDDIDGDDYDLLRRALDLCMTDPEGSAISFVGSPCPAGFQLTETKRNGTRLPFDDKDEANFVWGAYDVILDGAWHVIDIVHGMCFATFRANLNIHHKFQVAMEQLFRRSLLPRWSKVIRTLDDSLYDNLLGGPVNRTMRVMDACAQGAYIGSPFLHRLSRPVSPIRRRRKRDVSSTEERRKVRAFCLKTQDQHISKMSVLRSSQCD